MSEDKTLKDLFEKKRKIEAMISTEISNFQNEFHAEISSIQLGHAYAAGVRHPVNTDIMINVNLP